MIDIIIYIFGVYCVLGYISFFATGVAHGADFSTDFKVSPWLKPFLIIPKITIFLAYQAVNFANSIDSWDE